MLINFTSSYFAESVISDMSILMEFVRVICVYYHTIKVSNKDTLNSCHPICIPLISFNSLMALHGIGMEKVNNLNSS